MKHETIVGTRLPKASYKTWKRSSASSKATGPPRCANSSATPLTSGSSTITRSQYGQGKLSMDAPLGTRA